MRLFTAPPVSGEIISFAQRRTQSGQYQLEDNGLEIRWPTAALLLDIESVPFVARTKGLVACSAVTIGFARSGFGEVEDIGDAASDAAGLFFCHVASSGVHRAIELARSSLIIAGRNRYVPEFVSVVSRAGLHPGAKLSQALNEVAVEQGGIPTDFRTYDADQAAGGAQVAVRISEDFDFSVVIQ